MLTPNLGRTIVDKTGLTGNCDYTLKWASDNGQQEDGRSEGRGGPSLFTAMPEQLGLKLKSQKDPVDVIVADNFEKPSPN